MERIPDLTTFALMPTRFGAVTVAIAAPIAGRILENVLTHKSYYYFKFMGILAQYVNFIKEGMAYLSMLNDFAQKYECKPLRQQLKVVGKIELDPRDTSRHFNKK